MSVASPIDRSAVEQIVREIVLRQLGRPLGQPELVVSISARHVHVNVRGGGSSGQAGAVVLGVARALKRTDANFESVLRDQGFLTRDSRIVERKKYGQRGARRRFQFSKR